MAELTLRRITKIRKLRGLGRDEDWRVNARMFFINPVEKRRSRLAAGLGPMPLMFTHNA